MKKLSIIMTVLLSALIFASFSHAEQKTIRGKYTNTTGGRTDLSGLSNTIDVILNTTPGNIPTADPDTDRDTYKQQLENSYGGFYRGGNQTMKSIVIADDTSSSGFGAANIAGNFTVDTNAIDTYKAIEGGSLTLVASVATIKNSASTTASADITLDELIINGSSNQVQSLVFNNVTSSVTVAAATNIGQTSGTKSSIVIDSGSNVSWNGKLNVGIKDYATLDNSLLQIDGTLSMTGTQGISVYRGNLIISEGGVLNTNGNSLSVDVNGTLTVAGTINFNAGQGFINYGKIYLTNTNPTSQFMFESITCADNTSPYATLLQQSVATGENTGLWIRRSASLNYGSQWIINEKLDVGGVFTTDVASKIYVGGNSTIKIVLGEGQEARFRLLGNTTAQLSTDDAIRKEDGTSVKLITESADSSFGNTLLVNANQKFSQLEVNSDLEMTLLDGVKLTLDGGGQTISIAEGKVFTIYNFVSNTIYVGTELSDSVLDQIKAYDESSNLVDLGISDSGWLINMAVPEPAEWAAIFAALSLFAAIWRKRK